MMVPCALCVKSFSSFRQLKVHMDSCHKSINYFSCAITNCLRTFHLFNSYRRHYIRNHLEQANVRPQLTQQYISDDILPTISQNKAILTQDGILNDIQHTMPQINSENMDTVFFEGSALSPLSIGIAQLISSLYANSQLPQNVVDTVYNGIKKIMNDAVVPLLKENDCSSLGEDVHSVLSKFDSNHKRLQYFKNLGTYIEPKEYVVGRRYDYVKRGSTRVYETVNCVAHVIPLRDVLKNFFSLPNLLSDTLKYYTAQITHNGVEITHFVQGSFWKSRRELHGTKLVLPIFLQVDDFEPLNALGSHSSVHKLGAAYISLPCLPQQYASKLSNIFLALLYHTSDRVEFGNSVIFKPLIDEFNYLMKHGVKFELPDLNVTIFFELSVILGDNLGLHSITGFVESFSSNSSCRNCKVIKNNMLHQFYEDTSLLRNMDNYREDLSKHDVALTGVKEECVWLQVENFDLFSQLGVDVMHDLNEGVMKYIMSELLITLIDKKKYFSIHLFNNKLASFDYGPDRANIPVSLSIDNLRKGNIRLSGAEMATFCRYFGIIIGELVPRNDKYWAIYVQLMLVLDVIMSPIFQIEKLSYVQYMIAELCEMYTTLFNQKLKPKFHNLLHYHSAMLKFGPLRHLSSMRYEAKHRPSKLASKSSSNRINMSLTLAKRHQLMLNDIFLNKTLKNHLSFGIETSIPFHETRVLTHELGWVDILKIKIVSWASVSSVRYMKGSVVIYHVEPDFPQFAILQAIYVYDFRKLAFKALPMVTISFDAHHYAYHVEDAPCNAKSIYIDYDKMQYPFPNNTAIIGYGLEPQKYVILRKPL